MSSVGTHAGYGWSDADWQVNPAPGFSQGGSGGLLGGQIGYNIQMNQLVFGIEGDLSKTWIDGSSSCGGAFGCSHSINWMASLRGRLGVAVNNNRTLLYATGGAAWADVDWAGSLGTGLSKTQTGWVAGGGIEHMLTQNLSARVEYLYYGFDGLTAPAGVLGAGPANLDLTTQTVRFGLNLKF